MNSRLDELQAAILRERLGFLPAQTERRRAIATAYRDGIRNARVEHLAPPLQPGSHVHHLFVLRSSARDDLSNHLRQQGVESLCHYPVPVHHQVPCRDLARDPAGLGQAERHAAQCLSIPCHPYLGDADVASVIAAVNAF
jgi:dTDP-4-amino-4,6-dideoxygalactose transaminase